MKAAKIVAFIAFILNTFLAVNYVYAFLEFRQMFQELERQMHSLAPLSVILPFIFVILNLIYWLHLRNKEKKGERARFALLISILLLFLPQIIGVALIVKFFSIPLYKAPVF